MAGLPRRVRTVQDGLQPLQSLALTRRLERDFLWPDRQGQRDYVRNRPHLSQSHCQAADAKGSFDNGIGASRGGRSTRILALTDDLGRPRVLLPTTGKTHGLVRALAVLKLAPTPRKLLADRVHDARKLRDRPADRGCELVTPPDPTRKHPHSRKHRSAHDRTTAKEPCQGMAAKFRLSSTRLAR